MNWDTFIYFAAISMALSYAGAISALCRPDRQTVSRLLSAAGVAVLALFIGGFWVSLGRPPMRTMGETRLWYSLFVLTAGLLVYMKWKYRWLLSFTSVLASVFCMINILKPEIHDETLVPALQSIFFIPHVAVYMFAYGILACAFLLAVAGLAGKNDKYLESMDNLIYIGTGLLFLGMLSGSVWAKQAWGDFWDWDPKETWATITAAGYLAYIHLRFTGMSRSRWLYVIIIFSFIMLQMCWYGYRYLPSSVNSMHMYNVTA